MKFPRHILLAILFSTVIFPARTPAADDAPATLPRRTVDASVRDLGIQTELPLRRTVQVRESEPLAIPARVAEMTLLVALIVLITVIVYTIIINAQAGEQSDLRAPTAEENAAAVSRLTEAGSEAAAHADGGAYAEAMHTLLLRSVEELRRRLRVPLARSLTSREILYRIDLGPVAREAFRSLVDRVEVTYFGGREPSREDYEQCRESFDILTACLR
ncbi:MAG: DUF4129 domain-containing protein, partial [Planctomycetes bacterium]|nr:DUF4129 domain-containing protein [Planctomycetota bacterium]